MDENSPQYYWEIVERDGTVTKIPPHNVAVVQRRWTALQPIHTITRSIPAQQIVSFHITAERYDTVPLLEVVAQAFNDPMYTDSGAVKARWVKQTVPMERWQRYYSASPAYRFLGELNGMAQIAFIKPIHEIDVNSTPYLTDDELQKIDKLNQSKYN